MTGWLPLWIQLTPESPDPGELEESVLNRTFLLGPDGSRAGTLMAFKPDAWDALFELTGMAPGPARVFRVNGELIAAGAEEHQGREFVSLAVDLDRSSLHFDDPAVSGATRNALAWQVPMLGTRLVGISTLIVGEVDYAGALTVFRAGSFEEALVLSAGDPWSAIYSGRLFEVVPGFFSRGLPPPGPGISRYVYNVPWPGGRHE